MPFVKKEELEDLVLEEYTSGNITVMIRHYAFGQQRIQVCADFGYPWPDIIGPEC